MTAFTDPMLTMDHLDGHPIAAIDIETTGSEPGHHEICQIAIVPLNIHLEVADVLPFYSNICPLYPERANLKAMSVHGIRMDDLLTHAPSHSTVLRLLDDWFETLPLGHEKKLIPLAHNWPFERSMLVPWLGPDLFDTYFHHLYRDTMQMGVFLNDRTSLIGIGKVFDYVSLTSMLDKFGIRNPKSHDAYHDAVVTADLYRHMLTSVSTI